MFDFKRHESLRCLFASIASVTVMDSLLESDQFSRITAEVEGIDDLLVNVRSFFVTGMGLSRQEVRDRFIPSGSPLADHIYGVLFADAVRWWASAHRSRQDENKYLRDSMYKGEFVTHWGHFYHGFRNNQLAHFPGGKKSNDNPILTPSPYGFFLSQKEYGDFRSLLSHSIQLTLFGAEELERQWDTVNSLVENAEMSTELKEAVAAALRKELGNFDEEFLKMPTRDHFLGTDNG